MRIDYSKDYDAKALMKCFKALDYFTLKELRSKTSEFFFSSIQ